MKFPFYIARRYLFSKKSHNAINLISAISVCGVALTTMALVCTLSVFNGFHDLVSTLFTAFDADLRITPAAGKTFLPDSVLFSQLKEREEVAVLTPIIEENAMVQYEGKQAMATIRGVEENYTDLTPITTVLYGEGILNLKDSTRFYAIPGMQLLASLGASVYSYTPIEVYVPKRGERISLTNPTASFLHENLYTSGLTFAVNQAKYDGQYILTDIDFARKLLGYEKEVSALCLKVEEGTDVASFKNELKQLLGSGFMVADRYEQQYDTYKILQLEKFISYLFLAFVLLITCFNVLGSLSMLMIDKKQDVATLRNLGATHQQVIQIFVIEGILITALGALIGLVSGVILCLIQQWFGIITFANSASFIVDAYPVRVQFIDLLYILSTVLILGFLTVYYPARYLSKRFL